jgi:integrase
LPTTLIHDLRRWVARDFRRAGVDESTIMAQCGWKTRSMFDRYKIIDEQDRAAAVAKRFAEPNGKLAASNRPSVGSPTR